MSHPLLEHVKSAARGRKDPPVSDEYILAALEKVDRRDVEVDRYPGGAPSLKGVYTIAASLEASAATAH